MVAAAGEGEEGIGEEEEEGMGVLTSSQVREVEMG